MTTFHTSVKSFSAWGSILFPEVSIKREQSLVIGYIDDALFILGDVPVGGAGVVGLFGIADDVRQGNGILGLCLHNCEQQYKK
jgi:hypothetical protein